MTEEREIYVTMTGLPLSFKLEWPFHKSHTGSDFWVLHGDIRLENSEGLHAPVAVNLSATVKEIMPSLEAKDIEAPVINALRKEVDKLQVEFVKSGKMVPLQFSSRHYDFKHSKWVFGKASDEQMELLIQRKIYWHTKLLGGTVWVGDPTEALYVETTTGHILEIAGKLAKRGLLTLQAERASANAALMAQAERFESDTQGAMAELDKKHAYERG